MPLKNTAQEYGAVSKALHWLTAAVVVVLAVIAAMSDELPRGPEKRELVLLHASFGLLLLLLLAVRLLWRRRNITPEKMPHLSMRLHVLSRVVHYGLYLLLFAQALSGLMRFAAAGYPAPFFGLEIPLPLGKDEALKETAGALHELFPILILALLVLHIAAALYHHFYLKDNTLRRMTFGMKSEA